MEQTLSMVGAWSLPLQMQDHLPIIIALLHHNMLTVKGSVKESEVQLARSPTGPQEIASWKQRSI